MARPSLKIDNISVGDLIKEYQSGHIVIPEFQREYVWKKSRAPKLIDSLFRLFPVSSILLWQSSNETRARRNDPRPARSGSTRWLIDGQQRVITLSRVMTGEGGIDVVFHPDSEQFRLVNAAISKDKNWLPVADLWDDGAYRQLRRSLGTGRSADKREANLDRVRAVLDYQIPVIQMVGHTFEDAVEAFRRINTQGVKLKVEDIESAQIAARHSGFIADEVVPFLEKLSRDRFGRLNVMHLFRACAAIARPDGRSRTPLHELEKSEVLNAWKKTKRATELAIGLVKSELGLVNMEVLWSGALLVPLIVLCADMGPRDRNARAMVAWLALAALLHRYSVATETALDQDLRACRASDPVGALLKNLRTRRAVLRAKPDDFGGALNDRGALLAAYIACMHGGARDFFTDGKIVMQGTIDRHHILPRGQFAEKRRADADTVANVAFITSDVNRSINLSGPEVYLKDVNSKTLKSQCVPLDQRLWSVARADEFWASRQKLLAESFNDFLRHAMPDRRSIG